MGSECHHAPRAAVACAPSLPRRGRTTGLARRCAGLKRSTWRSWRCSKSPEVRPWHPADAPTIATFPRWRVTIRLFAPIGCRKAFRRVHAVALRFAHGNSPLPGTPQVTLRCNFDRLRAAFSLGTIPRAAGLVNQFSPPPGRGSGFRVGPQAAVPSRCY
jgi:hypothetical protein